MERCGSRLELITNHLNHVPKHTWFKSNGWGFRDTEFGLDPSGVVILKGNRYENSGKLLPNFGQWIQIQGLDFNSHRLPQKSMQVDPPINNPGFLAAIQKSGIIFSQEDEERAFHSHGHTLQEMYAVKFGKLEKVVDIVVFPTSETEVEAIMKLASEYEILLVPYGGGTNVTYALLLEASEKRMICSVDMSKMNHVRLVNLTSMTAVVEAGIAGRDLEKELSRYGVCCGHEPDSVEFSTLGGWISTRASGMKKNVYGNIEDIVLTIRIVTPVGTWEKPCLAPRMSTGPDVNFFILGHEGLFGIITQATIKIKELPEVKDYDSIIFPNFQIGTKFMYACGLKNIRPASIRLVDNQQFQFALALRPAAESKFKAIVDAAKKFYLTKMLKFKPDEMSVCTLVFEGSKDQVELQKKQVLEQAARFKGLRAGAENGKRGYFLTFSIAYIRDFGMEYYLFAESFETSVSWENLDGLLDKVPKVLESACSERGVKKKPFISSRITQLYDNGCCVYIYFGFFAKDLADPVQTYTEVEDCVRVEIMNCGGSLSHHHGIGKLRKGFMGKAVGEPALSILKGLQKTIDPKRILANSNLL